MTIVVTVKVNDGIVLASDSATSFVNTEGQVVKVYNNANKIFNLVKGCPIGAMTFGNGSIGTASIATLSKDFRAKLTDPMDPMHLDLQTYTMRDVAARAKLFLFDQCYRSEYPDGRPNNYIGYWLCGYSATGTLPEAWEIEILESECTEPRSIYDPAPYGPRWAGDTEALDRLVLGLSSRFTEALVDMGVELDLARQIRSDTAGRLYADLTLPAMPIQDAIDLAKYLADTAARFSQFSLKAATVGGPIETATITKHEGFRWVARKHYFSSEFN
ncbi:hypothetical protein NU688_33725 [Variovorax sp. ZS18.2.2]|uniref:hypothetical protein n=1 Tax=Variovorax sp. ZS18.2.2 TaxID=2971255 RepID=UPI002150E8BC|nr:hypothetical protein [Variovorax sp. ZS18.2.2]MCR6481159.1 hypothetical protein [Variovorax sp. ZS18.2.2]